MGARDSWVFQEEVSTDVLQPVLPGVCVVVGRGVGNDDGLPWGGAGCTVIGADDVCGGMCTVWARAAVMGSPSVGVMAASRLMVRRR